MTLPSIFLNPKERFKMAPKFEKFICGTQYPLCTSIKKTCYFHVKFNLFIRKQKDIQLHKILYNKKMFEECNLDSLWIFIAIFVNDDLSFKNLPRKHWKNFCCCKTKVFITIQFIKIYSWRVRTFQLLKILIGKFSK